MDNFLSLSFYIINFSISIFLSNIYQKAYKKRFKINECKKTIWFFLITLPPVLVSSLRYNVGTDYNAYIEIYNRINHYWTSSGAWNYYRNEPLFFLINKISYLLFDSYLGVFFLSSLIIHLFIMLGLDNYKEHISISFALFIYYMYFFNFSLNGIRQTIALSIVFFALKYLLQRSFIKYLYWVVVATLFHNTAILTIPLYFLIYLNNNPAFKFVYYLSILLTPFVLIILIGAFINLPILESYSHYVTNKQLVIKPGFAIHILPILIPVFLFKKNVIRVNTKYQVFFDISLLNIPYTYVAYYVDWGQRMAKYTNTVYLLLIPLAINSVRKEKNKHLLLIYYIIYFAFYYIGIYVLNNSSEAFPYRSILDQISSI